MEILPIGIDPERHKTRRYDGNDLQEQLNRLESQVEGHRKILYALLYKDINWEELRKLVEE